MHVSTQWANILNAIGGLLVGAVAVTVVAFVGALMWEVGIQKADWSARVVAFGFWFWGGTSVVVTIWLSLAPWWSPAQDNFLRHLVLDSVIFSFTVLTGGMLIGSIPGRKP